MEARDQPGKPGVEIPHQLGNCATTPHADRPAFSPLPNIDLCIASCATSKDQPRMPRMPRICYPQIQSAYTTNQHFSTLVKLTRTY